MNLALNALTGAQIPFLVCLLVIIGFLCAIMGFLIYKIISTPSKKSKRGPEATISPEPIDRASLAQPQNIPQEAAVPEEIPVNTVSEPPIVCEVPQEQPAETPAKTPADEQPSGQPAQEPAEEPIRAENSAVCAEVSAASEISGPIEEEETVEEEESAGEPVAEPAEEPVEEAAHVESTAETVEEILEEHGLSSADEITEEIAEEIMAVSAHHDEEAVEVVVVDGLYKKYSKKADYAVSNVNFRCYEGEIVGLLGHNGAGKSTTLKCLEGMLPFEKGTISIYGYDIVKEPIKAKANMGFVTDNHATFIKMTGMQYLDFMADIYDVPTEVRKERVEKLESVFMLGDAINNLISSYSHGMRQKICMMGSLMHMPKLWVLDEPMTGLDPRTMHAVQEFMREYADAGNCIIFSSHALITVARMCDRVVLLRTGQQLDELNIKRIMTVDPNFDFEEYFLKHEGQV